MSSFIKNHPIYGAFFLSTAIAKGISKTRWYPSKLSELELEKTILDSGRSMEPRTRVSLSRAITFNQIELRGGRLLSKSFFSLLAGVIAVYVDHRIIKNGNKD